MKPETQVKLVEKAKAMGIDLARLPEHIAIIMDGNGRWAKGRGLARLLGHKEGYDTLKAVVKHCSDLGVKYLTVYGFSSENWRRPQEEVSGLMALIERAMREQIAALKDQNVRVRVIGRLAELPTSLQAAFADGMAETSSCTGLNFTLAINYGGRAEIVDAVRTLVAEGCNPSEINESSISSRLYQSDAPEPDLMIRTAGEMRWSNFLIWQSAYAELFVTKVAWPEFESSHLLDAIHAFQGRYRKFGGL